MNEKSQDLFSWLTEEENSLLQFYNVEITFIT